MTPDRIIRTLEEKGHSLSIQGGQIKVVTKNGHLESRDAQWLKDNRAVVINCLISRRMTAAIEAVETAFHQRLNFDGALEVEKEQLDRMHLNTVEDIARWEAGWIRIITRAGRGKNS